MAVVDKGGEGDQRMKKGLTSIANTPLRDTRQKESHQILGKGFGKSIDFPWKAHFEVFVQLVHGICYFNYLNHY